MARTNYGFEKRQREMAKKQKKEEKRLKKAATGAAPATDDQTGEQLPDTTATPPEGETGS